MPRGDCFEVAVRMLEDPPLEVAGRRVRRFYVVHGTPAYAGPTHTGLRFWHAWNEAEDETGMWWVLDYSGGMRTILPRDLYYAVGELYDPVIAGDQHEEPDTERQVWRYSDIEAATEMLACEHYGPWLLDADDYVDLSLSDDGTITVRERN